MWWPPSSPPSPGASASPLVTGCSIEQERSAYVLRGQGAGGAERAHGERRRAAGAALSRGRTALPVVAGRGWALQQRECPRPMLRCSNYMYCLQVRAGAARHQRPAQVGLPCGGLRPPAGAAAPAGGAGLLRVARLPVSPPLQRCELVLPPCSSGRRGGSAGTAVEEGTARPTLVMCLLSLSNICSLPCCVCCAVE